MDLIIGLIVAVKSLVFMGGFISPDKLPVRIAAMQVNITQQDVRVSCAVSNAFTKDLRKLTRSGTPILLYVFSQVKQAGHDSLVAGMVIENMLVYDLAKKKYLLKQGLAKDTLSFANQDSAIAAASSFPMMPVMPKAGIVPDKAYYFILWAVLGKARVEALGNKDIDLMYFWDYKRPSLKTDPFLGTQLLATKGNKQ
jgi:hypothetical protein